MCTGGSTRSRKPNFTYSALRVAGVQAPAEVALGPAVDSLADQFDAEAAAAVGGVDEDVAEVGEHGAV